MKKIVFLGCENSHSKQFLTYIKEDKKYKDIEVVGCYSIEDKAKNDLADTFGIKALSKFDEANDKVKGVIVTARDGNFHFKFVKPYLKKGMTVFVDKPITISEEDAVALAKLAKKNGVKLLGGSSLIFDENIKKFREQNFKEKSFGGFVRAPISMNNPYGGFYFYSEHLVDMVCYIWGFYPKSVIARDYKDHISITFKYQDYDVEGIFGKDNYVYSAGIFTKEDSQFKEIPITGGEQCFKDHFDEFYNAMNSRSNKTNYKEFIAPVFILNAIEKSLNTKKEEVVRKIPLK